MSSKQQSLKVGEKVLFGIFGVFLVAAVIGYIILEVVRFNSEKPIFETKTHFALSEEGKLGSRLFRESRCTSCHRAMRNGTNMGLNLDGVGSKRTKEWLYEFMLDPERVYGSRTLDHGLRPKEAAYVADMPKEELHAIAVFLSELRSEQGSASAPMPPDGQSKFIDNMVKTFAPDDWKEKYEDVRDRPQGAEQ